MAGKNQRHGLGNRGIKFLPRLETPTKSKYYWGESPYRPGGISMFDYHSGRQGNCTAYAWGRFWEISEHFGKHTRLSSYGNAEDWYYGTNSGFSRGKTPQLGAVICYANGPVSGLGHVMIVEKIVSSTHIVCSESGYRSYLFQTCDVYKKSNGWHSPSHPGYDFQGFIYNPNVPRDVLLDLTSSLPSFSFGDDSGAVSEEEAQTIKANIKYKTVSTKVTTTKLHTYRGNLKRTKAANLLSYPSLVESPFVMVKIGEFTFGTYTHKNLDTTEKAKYRRMYPNFVKSLQVVKVNGTVNQYVLTLVYQIEPGNDPNYVDKILSKVGYGKIKISYGDWASPEFIYREEEALVTKVTSNVDFGNSRITYVLYCTSSSLSLASNTYNWRAREAKPSDVIIDVLKNKKYGLTDIFYGMKNISKKALRSTLIASDDKVVKIGAKQNLDPLSYINYLVTCMTSVTNKNNNTAIKDSSYYLTIHDDVYGDQNLKGPYFKITKVKSKGKTLQTADTYEVDINYPSDNLVTSFNINNDNSWSLLYRYSDKVTPYRYYYTIGDDGIVNSESTPNSLVSADKYKMVTESQKTWWTKMTQFPITATMTIKGLVRPAMLMTYIRVNAFFYGQRHVSSGLYIVTKQEDKIDQAGYRTTLTLQRIAGDNDYFTSTTKTVKIKVVDSISYEVVGNSGSSGDTNIKSDREKNDEFYNETLVNILGKNNITDHYNGKRTANQVHKSPRLVKWYGTYQKYLKAWETYGNIANTTDKSSTTKPKYVQLPNGNPVNRKGHR